MTIDPCTHQTPNYPQPHSEPNPRTAAALLRILLRRGLAPQSVGGTAGGDDNQSHLTIGMDADAIAAGWHPQEGPSVYQVLAGCVFGGWVVVCAGCVYIYVCVCVYTSQSLP